MIKEIELKLLPEEAANNELIREKVLKKLKLKPGIVREIVPLRRSVDARGKEPRIIILLKVYINELPEPEAQIKGNYQKLNPDSKKVIIVGSGPAGYFAALELIELGIKPVIFERGKDVNARRYDLRAIQQQGTVNPHSNYCFGEGGAGTYSDGKLYTRSTKRGDVNKVLKILVEHGAKMDILVDTHPHIGSNKLPVIVRNIRETIQSYGGEVYFDAWVSDLIIKDDQIQGVIVNEQDEHYADAVILATGHSARDVFYLLNKKGIELEAKPFAIGVRVEHPQSLIDKIQYNHSPRNEFLPAASYKLVTQVEGKGVFSFCMCPGGFIVPAATAPGEIVINGMSLSKRNSKFANSGIVVSVGPEDLPEYQQYGHLACLEFQKEIEKKVFEAGDQVKKAPAQRLTDFVKGEMTANLPETSYVPGFVPAELHKIFPEAISKRLQQAFIDFDKKMNGFLSEEAVIVATESRTSSPVKVPRDNQTLMHPYLKNFYPCGEGAGYAGGIVSAAIDGQNVARAISKNG